MAVLAGLTGCGGGGSAPVAAEPARAPVAVAATAADPAPGRVLSAFVRAAQRGDRAALWARLSAPTRAGLGGTVAGFRGDAGADLVSFLGRVRGRPRVVLSRRVGRRWAVAAIAGRRPAGGDGEDEDFAYAVALRRAGAAWRIELGGVIVGGVRPSPLDEVEPTPPLRADVAAGERPRVFLLWLDGRAVAARAEADTPFAARIRARPARPLRAGRHTGVAFAATRDAAGAVAWPFTVGR